MRNIVLNGFSRLMLFLLNKFSKTLSSFPYLSPDTFKSFADTKILSPDNNDINYTRLSRAKVIYCKSDYLEYFLKELAIRIPNPFVLVTGDSDISPSISKKQLIPNHLIHWFGQNINFSDARISPFPIGLENFNKFSNGNILDYWFLRITRVHSLISKRCRLAYGFSLRTNYEKRKTVLEIVQNHKYSENISSTDAYEYRRKLIQYKFVVSPPGNGIDCHRTWEAMYLKTVPICEDSELMRYFYNLGLPILFVETWEEMLDWDEAFLEAKYREMLPRFSSRYLWAGAWKRKIRAKVRK